MKTLTFVLMISFVVCQGCAWFVPGTIKRETSLVHTDILISGGESSNLLNEAKQHIAKGDEFSAVDNWEAAAFQYRLAASRSRDATMRILRSYDRMLPHVDNLERYMMRKKSSKGY